MKSVDVVHGEIVIDNLIEQGRPVLIKNYVEDWPVVKAARKSDVEVMNYISSFANENPVVLYELDPENQGRFFYSKDFKKLNFKASRASLVSVFDQLKKNDVASSPKTYYVGSTTIDKYLPGFREENDLSFDVGDPIVSIWLGNQSTVAAHFDAPDNIACCIAGRRTFTLFPPEQLENLYIGPLDNTPSGQPISIVNLKNPDFKKFPRFKLALESAFVVDLEPGDALFLPSMWWHHVESSAQFNGLVNYWWRDVPSYKGPGMEALKHAILSIRDLPRSERTAWKAIFDYYVFSDQKGKFDYLPLDSQEFLAPLDDIKARQLRAWLLNRLNR